MSQVSPDQLMPVAIKSFRNTTRDIAFDVYLRVSDDNYAHVFSRTTGLDYKRLANYIQMGVESLYILKTDEPAYKDFVSRPAFDVFKDPAVPQEKKIAALLNMTEQNMAEIFSQVEVPTETAESAQKLVRSYVDIMVERPQTLAVILRLVSHGEYLYYHSVAVSIFAMLLARASGRFDQRTVEMIGMGGFLHDIGVTHLSDDMLLSPDALTPEQWDEMHKHPGEGLKMIEGNPAIPQEVRYMVYQHHEEPCGQGYPNKLRSGKIYPPAHFIAVADAFSALISERPFRPALTVEEAIRTLTRKTGKHDAEVLKLLKAVFLPGVIAKKIAA